MDKQAFINGYLFEKKAYSFKDLNQDWNYVDNIGKYLGIGNTNTPLGDAWINANLWIPRSFGFGAIPGALYGYLSGNKDEDKLQRAAKYSLYSGLAAGGLTGGIGALTSLLAHTFPEKKGTTDG